MSSLMSYFQLHDGGIIASAKNWVSEPSAEELHGPFGRIIIGYRIIFSLVPVDVQSNSNSPCKIQFNQLSKIFLIFTSITSLTAFERVLVEPVRPGMGQKLSMPYYIGISSKTNLSYKNMIHN